jgi:hypothetical protein
MSMRAEPVTFSMAFGLPASRVVTAGAIDVALNCDTNLFIDPLLLSQSTDQEFAACASAAYERRFGTIIDLLSQSQARDDFAWRNAERLFVFPEIRYTHLGYSGGASGSGSGSKIRASLMQNSREAIRLGIRNPNLFLVLALFEEGVGADRISDMVTRIVQPCLCQFTARVAAQLGVACEPFGIEGAEFALPRNPLAASREPIILVPHDVVRDLPMASDWSSVAAAARETEDLRARVSEQIGEIWAAKTRRDKDAIRRTILSRREAFERFLDLLEAGAVEPYDVREDHLGEIYPADLRRQIAAQLPLDLTRYSGRRLGAHEVAEVVRLIVEHFRTLIEQNGLWELLYDDDRVTPRREKAAQRLFFAVAAAYCAANNLDLSPEADAGCGPVDFKISQGAASKVIVELKKSTNSKLVDAFESQLGAYEGAERPHASHYVVLDVGRLTPTKRRALHDMHAAALAQHGRAPQLWFVDATPKESASHR